MWSVLSFLLPPVSFKPGLHCLPTAHFPPQSSLPPVPPSFSLSMRLVEWSNDGFCPFHRSRPCKPYTVPLSPSLSCSQSFFFLPQYLHCLCLFISVVLSSFNLTHLFCELIGLFQDLLSVCARGMLWIHYLSEHHTIDINQCFGSNRVRVCGPCKEDQLMNPLHRFRWSNSLFIQRVKLTHYLIWPITTYWCSKNVCQDGIRYGIV